MGKVIAFIANLSKGGAQGVFVNVVNYLHQSGIEVDVVVQNLHDPVYKDDLAPEIRITDLNVGSAKKLLPKLNQFVKQNAFGLAMAFSPEIGVNLVLARKLSGRKFAILGRCINTLSLEYSHATGFFRKHITHRLIRMFYHKVDRLIAQSKGMGDDLTAHYHFTPSQITVINNALGQRFEEVLDQPSPYSERQSYLLYAGRLEEQKGLSMLLEAFSLVRDKSVGLKLIGSGSDQSALEAQAKALGIAARVEFIPYTRRIVDYYQNARLTVLSSYFEGFPNVLSESIACGTPVVSFDLPSGPSEIIIEGVNGYLAEYLDVLDLAAKIDLALSREWDDAAVKQTAHRYTRSLILEQYREVVEAMLESSEK